MIDYHNPNDVWLMTGYDPNKKATEDDRLRDGCVDTFVSLCIFALVIFVIFLFCSCASTKETSYVERQHVTDIMQRMDSLFHIRTVTQQDSAWRETILKQFQSIRERTDTSHHVVVDSAGRVIKETLVINNVREVTSETDRQEIQFLSSRIEMMDSTMNSMRLQIQRSDSLLQQRQDVIIKEVDKPLNWWQQARLHLANIILITLALLAVLWLIRKRTWWLGLLRKLI